MSDQLRIPSITLDDLVAYHSRVFGKLAALSTIKHPVTGTTVNQEHTKENGDEDDGLGYYPDGVKRTLTDEQIAIFKHSEIQSLLREKELQDNNGRPETLGHLGSSTGMEVEEEDDDEEGYARFIEAERKEIEADRARRKRYSCHKISETSRTPTERGLVRELDYVTDSNAFLDYGDESLPLPKLATGKNTPGHLSQDNIMYSIDDSDTPVHNANRVSKPTGGRKIWWPNIEISNA